jgi:hypothetical protein
MRRLRALADLLSEPRGRWLATAVLLACALLLVVLPVRAAEPAAAMAAGSAAIAAGAPAPADEEWITVGDATLDVQRGGFDAGGLMVSFGIERMVRIDGALVATTSFQVNDLGRLTPEQAQAVGRQASQLNLVQNGPGNGIDPRAVPPGGPATFIQNTLNGQRIENRTVINATSNGLGLVKDLNASGALRDALAGALSAR